MPSIKPDELAAAIEQELTLYKNSVQVKLNAAGLKAIKNLVQKTKATAPKGHRRSKHFRESIAMKAEDVGRKADKIRKYIWYVKAPNHRLTHLLVYGHVTRDGGRSKADPFLQNALESVLTEYEKDVQEALRSD